MQGDVVQLHLRQLRDRRRHLEGRRLRLFLEGQRMLQVVTFRRRRVIGGVDFGRQDWSQRRRCRRHIVGRDARREKSGLHVAEPVRAGREPVIRDARVPAAWRDERRDVIAF